MQDTLESLDVLLSYKPPKSSSVELDVNMLDHQQRTCLHYAVVLNRLEAATVLISRGAKVDIKDSEGRTVMDYAMELTSGKEEMIVILRSG